MHMKKLKDKIDKNRLLLTAFSVVFVMVLSFAGLVHNHEIGESHDDCPAYLFCISVNLEMPHTISINQINDAAYLFSTDIISPVLSKIVSPKDIRAPPLQS